MQTLNLTREVFYINSTSTYRFGTAIQFFGYLHTISLTSFQCLTTTFCFFSMENLRKLSRLSLSSNMILYFHVDVNMIYSFPKPHTFFHIVCCKLFGRFFALHRNEIISFFSNCSIHNYIFAREMMSKAIHFNLLFTRKNFLCCFLFGAGFYFCCCHGEWRRREKFMTLQISFQQSSWYYTIHSSFYLHNAIFHEFSSVFFTTTDSDDW